MDEQKGNFKTQVFGGFDRHDVIDYIEKLAAQRNAYQKERDTLEQRRDELELENSALKGELADVKTRLQQAIDGAQAARQEAAEKALAIVNDAREACAAIRSDVAGSAKKVQAELTVTAGAMDGITASLDAADARFEALAAELSGSGDENEAEENG